MLYLLYVFSRTTLIQAPESKSSTMITYNPRPSATIIAFPDAAGRRAIRFQEEARRIVEARYDTVADYEGGWYHHDAIREAELNPTKQ